MKTIGGMGASVARTGTYSQHVSTSYLCRLEPAELLGTLVANGFPLDLAIISDDAGQFNALLHALCWIHTDRVFQRILPLNDTHAKEIDWVHTQIWEIYSDLKQYKRKQEPDLKAAIKAHFDELCRTKTSFATLNRALIRLARNNKELLLVLERSDIPLHNNFFPSPARLSKPWSVPLLSGFPPRSGACDRWPRSKVA